MIQSVASTKYLAVVLSSKGLKRAERVSHSGDDMGFSEWAGMYGLRRDIARKAQRLEEAR